MGKLSKIRAAGVALFTILFLLETSSLLFAQEPPHRIYSNGLGIINVNWSNDSRSLIFQELLSTTTDDLAIGVNVPLNTWNQYNVNTKQTTKTNQWPLQVSLTQTQQQSFHIATDGNQISFVYRSPNSRFIVYAAKKPALWDSPAYPLGIADLQSNQYRILENIGIADLENTGNAFGVIWSADSSAFIIRTVTALGGGPRPFYIGNFGQSLTNLNIVALRDNGISLGSETVYPQYVYDISNNGQLILLDELKQDYTSRLIVWNIDSPNQSQIVAQGHIREAAFLPTNEQRILYIDDGGVNLHNLTTSTSAVLEPSFTYSFADGGAWISPDGTKIAFYNENSGGLHNLYIIPLLDVLALFHIDTNHANLLNTPDNNPPASAYYLRPPS